jgi:tetratricopeptide (TPR) repeat protein
MGPSAQLWDEAQAELESALKLEPNNPIVNSLLANVYFAQFQILQASGDTVAGAAKRRLANQFAGEAKQNSNQVFESDRLEIEADFHFYRGNFQQAAASYRQLAEQGTTLAHIDRARWMLAGIYSGDWGIGTSAAELVDARQARAQIVQLLAFFPESPHTQLLEKHLLWDDVRGATLSAHLPRTQVGIPVQP